MIQSVNPYNNQFIQNYNLLSSSEIESKIFSADQAFQKWKSKTVKERLALVSNLGKVLLEKKNEAGKIITIEMGKLIGESVKEIEKSATLCEYYNLNAEKFLADENINSRFKKSYVKHQPLGVILGVMPWNFPFWQVIRFAVPALIAGNICLLKHSSNVIGSALVLEKVFKEAGFENNEFQLLIISSSQVEEVISNKLVKGVSLTGSEGAGSSVASIAGKHIKKSVLELGGSDPLIICDDADSEKAFDEACLSKLINSGQSCISAKRFIVHEKLHDSFIEMMKSRFEKYSPADPLLASTQLAPLAKEEFAVDVMKTISEAKDKGAKIHCGNKREGAFIFPTVISEITPAMKIYHEEMFAPVASVYKFKTDDEAIAIANSSRFGLSSSVWSKDISHAESIASSLENGSVYINAFSKSDPTMPFGGVKFSGYGREMSKQGLMEFVNIKSVIVD